MLHVHDIFDYDENFVIRFSKNVIPFFDLWTISTLSNYKKVMCAGTSEDMEKFRNCLDQHSQLEIPPDLVITIGNAEKSNPDNILNNTKKYFKLRFEKGQSNEFGEPFFNGITQLYPTQKEQMMSLPFQGFGQRPQAGMGGMGGFSFQDLQGIIDKNVSDAARSIRAEYDENIAKREAESIRRIADLEMKMEFYKLELRAKEVEDKERKLMEEMDDFEERKAEGLGTVKEYTKTIAGGLLELGKSAFGLDEAEDRIKKSFKKKDKEAEPQKSNLKGTSSFDDDGFTSNSSTKQNNTNNFSELLGVIKGLSVEERMQLMDVLIPEEMEGYEDDDSENNATTELNINQKNSEENEDLQTDNID